MLDVPPDTLIDSTIENFLIQPDIDNLARIAKNLKKTNELRETKIENLRNQITSLQSEVDALKGEIKAMSQPNSAVLEQLSEFGAAPLPKEDESIFKVINAKSIELDNLKVSLAKRLTDLESVINQMDMVKVNLARRSEEVSHQKEQALASNIATNFNSNSMRISLYKSLGVHIEELEDGNDKVVVFGPTKNLTSVLQVDEKYLDYFISNYIWEKIGS